MPDDPELPVWGLERIQASPIWALQPVPRSTIRIAFMEADGPFDHVHDDLLAQVSPIQNDSRSATAHGTRVCGVAGATGNNSLDIAGVANIELVALDKGSSSVGFAQAISWALNHDIDVINMSFKFCGQDCGECANPVRSLTAQDAITNALDDIVFVASAGNDSCDTDPFGRAQLPQVMMA